MPAVTVRPTKRGRDSSDVAGRNTKRQRSDVETSKPDTKPDTTPAKRTRKPNLLHNSQAQLRPVEVIVIPDDEPVADIEPSESHEDDIIVNSREHGFQNVKVGVDDYIDKLRRRSSYKHVQVTTKIDFKESSDFERDRDLTPSTKFLKADVDYAQLPISKKVYDTKGRRRIIKMYSGSTYNPKIGLAITRVAQKNLPFVNFLSALNHLPNVRASEPLPRLPSDLGFLDYEPYMPRLDDVEIKTKFISNYYDDGRHCVGYHVDNPGNPDRPTCLFTPCTYDDLKEFGLLNAGTDSLWNVACDDGRWLDSKYLRGHDIDIVRETLECLLVWVQRFYSMQEGNEQEIEDSDQNSVVPPNNDAD